MMNPRKCEADQAISKRCAMIRSNWSPVERQRRRVLAQVAQESLLRRSLQNRRELASV